MAKNYRLLVADDEQEIRKGMGTYFPWAQLGIEVVGYADNGRSAFDFILKNEVDIALCDIRMPLMSGLDLAREIKAAGLPTKIVLYSGYREFEYATKAMSYGVSRYIVKSAKFAELIEVLGSLTREMDEEQRELRFEQTRENLRTDNPPESHGVSLPTDAATHHGQAERVIQAVTRYVEGHLDENLSLENMARYVNLNADYLGKLFKQQRNQNYSDYVMQVKMKAAAAMLDDFKNHIYEIAVRLGYNNAKNFTRAFRAFFGTSPREYRNQ